MSDGAAHPPNFRANEMSDYHVQSLCFTGEAVRTQNVPSLMHRDGTGLAEPAGKPVPLAPRPRGCPSLRARGSPSSKVLCCVHFQL